MQNSAFCQSLFEKNLTSPYTATKMKKTIGRNRRKSIGGVLKGGLSLQKEEGNHILLKLYCFLVLIVSGVLFFTCILIPYHEAVLLIVSLILTLITTIFFGNSKTHMKKWLQVALSIVTVITVTGVAFRFTGAFFSYHLIFPMTEIENYERVINPLFAEPEDRLKVSHFPKQIPKAAHDVSFEFWRETPDSAPAYKLTLQLPHEDVLAYKEELIPQCVFIGTLQDDELQQYQPGVSYYLTDHDLEIADPVFYLIYGDDTLEDKAATAYGAVISEKSSTIIFFSITTVPPSFYD